MDAETFDREMDLHRSVQEREERVFRAIMRGVEDEAMGRVRSLDQACADARNMRSANAVMRAH